MLKFKLLGDEKSIAMNEKGLPIVIDNKDKENPKEFVIDAIHQYSQIPVLRKEAKDHREEKEKLQKLFKYFEDAEIDLSDDDKTAEFVKNAKEALELVKNIDDKKLIDAGEVETIKRQAQEAMQTKLDEITNNYDKKLGEKDKEVGSLNGTVYQLMVANQFHSSKFVKDKMILTPIAAFRYFMDNIKIEMDENGFRKVVLYYPNVNGQNERVYSEERTGELANFDEGLELIVNKDPDRDSLLKGVEASGGGAAGGAGGTGGTTSNPFIKGETFNLTKQADLFKTDQKKYDRLKREAEGS